MENKVIVQNELGEFFKSEVERIAKEIPQKGYTLFVSVRPYLLHNVSYKIDDANRAIFLEYYSALRYRPQDEYYHCDLVKELSQCLNKD